MTWEDYIQRKIQSPALITRIKTDIECPRCGRYIWKRVDMVLLSNPRSISMNATADGQDIIRREGIIMKIIGKTDDGFILEASRDDVAGLEGLYAHEKNFRVGDLIDFDKFHIKYRLINSALNDISRLKAAAQRIIDNAAWVEEFRNGE